MTATWAEDTARAPSASARNAAEELVAAAAAETARTRIASDGAGTRTSSMLLMRRKYPGAAPLQSTRRSEPSGPRLSQTVPPHIGHGGRTRCTTAP